TGAFEQLVQPGVSGALVDTGDAAGLSRAVLQVLREPERALAMGQAARERVLSTFTLAREAEGIGRVYQGLFDAAGARRPGA
ncbi:glycosyltransferase, partial [Limnohabitans sp.]|uniref:glycosyltransferase n=1 Tax=Limnohabitans sp. TaxID=1907725 RepID=UPI00391BD267